MPGGNAQVRKTSRLERAVWCLGAGACKGLGKGVIKKKCFKGSVVIFSTFI